MKTLSDNIKSLLALIIVISSLTYLFMITLLHPDGQVLSQAIIAIVTALSTATGYYFGYSNGAAKKDEALMNKPTMPVINQADTINLNKN